MSLLLFQFYCRYSGNNADHVSFLISLKQERQSKRIIVASKSISKLLTYYFELYYCKMTKKSSFTSHVFFLLKFRNQAMRTLDRITSVALVTTRDEIKRLPNKEELSR